jgi:hypothetical protein
MLRRHVVIGAIAAAIDVAVLVIYWALLVGQAGPHNAARITFFTAVLALLAVASLASPVLAGKLPGLADSLTFGAAVGNMAIGAISLASIGLPIVIAGVLLLASWATSGGKFNWQMAVIAVAVIVTVILGLLATSG